MYRVLGRGLGDESVGVLDGRDGAGAVLVL